MRAGASGSVRDGFTFLAQASAVERLKRRTDFKAAAAGVRAPGKAFVLQARCRTDNGTVRIGYTVSKQVGNAVERNRVRRRLREIVRHDGAKNLRTGHDYVLIGRRAALALPFGEMIRELETALRRIHAKELAPAGESAARHGKTGSLHKQTLHEAGSPAPRQAKPRQKPSRTPTGRMSTE